MAKILVVDDNKKRTAYIAEQLRAAGHAATVLHNGRKALELLGHEPFDLVLLDVMLPGMSGFEVCRRIRTDASLFTTPVMFMSAMSGDEEIQHGFAQGAEDYIPKPFRLDNLLQRLESVLESHADHRMLDEATTLPGPKRIKLAIQRTITLKQPFAMAYAELEGLRAFLRATHNEARAKALRHFARGLKMVGEELTEPPFEVGHLGGGHFACMLPPDSAQFYCDQVMKLWEGHLPNLYESLGIRGALSNGDGAERAVPVVMPVFCVAQWNPNAPVSMNALFETLSHLRQQALATPGGGVFLDRRG